MRLLRTRKTLFAAGALACLALAGAGCQPAADNANTTTTANTNATTNTSVNANATSTTTTSAPTSTTTIEAREPEKYTATMVVTLTPSGQQAQALPEVKVARNGTDRRYSFTLPMAGEIVFLDKADKRYVILPARKQYLELTPEMTGFEVPRSMTPGQMVAQLERQQGVERVGEETLNGRQTVKYRYAAQANTNTQAGQVATDTYIYVDQETGLPLRIEGYGQSTGNVQGVNSGRATVEMRNLSTDVDPSEFDIPQGYAKLTPQEVQQQTRAILAGLQFFLNAFNAQQQAGAGAAPGASPVASPSPAATR